MLLHDRRPKDSKLPQAPHPAPCSTLLWGQEVKLTAATASLWPLWASEMLMLHANESHTSLQGSLLKKPNVRLYLPLFCLGQGSCRVLTLEHAREFRQLKASSGSYYVRNPIESPNPNKLPQKGQRHPVL